MDTSGDMFVKQSVITYWTLEHDEDKDKRETTNANAAMGTPDSNLHRLDLYM